LNTTNKTKNIIVNGNYSNTKIICAPEVPFDFDINLKYGGFKDQIGLKYSEKSEKNNSKNYSGYNISEGKSSISVTTNYGSVQLLNK
jgi:predicted membrane protein